MHYRFARFLFLVIFKLFNRFKVTGLDNFPLDDKLIVVSNHISILDPIVVGVGLPRQVRFMAKKELFQNFLLKGLIRALGAFPVDRHKTDFQAMKMSFQVLKNQEVLGMFPEGTRNQKGIGSFHTGAAAIALKANCKVLPVAIVGTDKFFRRFFFTELHLSIGPVISWPVTYQGKPTEEDIKKLTREMQKAVQDLLL